jgi:hypothetical protein
MVAINTSITIHFYILLHSSYKGVKIILKNNSSRITLVTFVLAAIASLVGCSTNKSKQYYLETTNPPLAFTLGGGYTQMGIDIPSTYGDIPVHPDDNGRTRKVDLNSGWYTVANLGIDFSPLPFEFLENLRVGYTAVIPASNPNLVREGLSQMEWYEYGSYAGTYSRVEVPDIIHNLKASWRQPLQLGDANFFVESGVSYDIWTVYVEGGWDRYYHEQAMLRDKVKSETLNPFVRAGLFLPHEDYETPSAFCFFWKQEKIEGNTPYGEVDVTGNTFGVELLLSF